MKKSCILMIVALVAGGTASAQLSPAQLSEQQMQAEAFEDATGSTPEEAAEEFSSGVDSWLENLLKDTDEASSNSLNNFLRAFSPENLMPELPELARQWRIPFYALAMLIFISSAISTLAKYRTGSPDATQAGVSLILAILLAVNVVPTINFFIGAADSIVDYGAQRANVEVDLTNPWALAENLTDLAWTFSRVDISQGEPFEQVMVAASVRAALRAGISMAPTRPWALCARLSVDARLWDGPTMAPRKSACSEPSSGSLISSAGV